MRTPCRPTFGHEVFGRHVTTRASRPVSRDTCMWRGPLWRGQHKHSHGAWAGSWGAHAMRAPTVPVAPSPGDTPQPRREAWFASDNPSRSSPDPEWAGGFTRSIGARQAAKHVEQPPRFLRRRACACSPCPRADPCIACLRAIMLLRICSRSSVQEWQVARGPARDTSRDEGHALTAM